MTVEIAAYVLLGCLLVCIGFMLAQERKYHRRASEQERRIFVLKAELEATESLVGSLRDRLEDAQHRDPRAGLHPGNPDAEVRYEDAQHYEDDGAPPRMRRYVALRGFTLGRTGTHVNQGEVVEFDGRTAVMGGTRQTIPALRGAIQGGWLRALDVPLRTLPPDWQERLLRPTSTRRESEAIEGLKPRCYEVGPTEPVVVNGRLYNPGQLIPAEEMAHLKFEDARKFEDAGLITPSSKDPRPTRYDILTEDEGG